jgi:hypothetical protein
MSAVPGLGDPEPDPRDLFEVFYPRLAGWTAKLVGDRDLAHEIATEASLPDRLRMPVLLHYDADLPVAQVASLLEVAEGTVKRALFDARAVMARQLEKVRP